MKSISVILLLISFTLGACHNTPASDPRAGPPTYPIRAVALSPQGFPNDFTQLAQFYEEASDVLSGGVLYNGGWREDIASGTDSGEVPEPIIVQFVSAQTYGYTPITVIGWRTNEAPYLSVPGASQNDWSNAEAKDAMLTMLVNLAETYQPPLLFLGNENDFYFQQNPDDYLRWIDFYNQAYAAIKEASPQTQVGPVFNYEHLAGTGRFTGWLEPQWDALEAHALSEVDVVGLSLYPFFSTPQPSELQSNYLDPLFQRLGQIPIVITETGWPAELPYGVEPGWSASEEAQVEYLTWLEGAIEGRNVLVVTWLFLYPPEPPPGGSLDLPMAFFASISLRDHDGRARPIYQAWLDFYP